jgi:hypothetical protein
MTSGKRDGMILLIYPPTAKPCEPSAGLARLAGALAAHNQPVAVWDANLAALHDLLLKEPQTNDHWTGQARRRRTEDLLVLQNSAGYRHFDAYSAAVRRLNRLLAANSKEHDATVSLTDYQHRQWSPLRSDDLLAAAAAPERSPFYDFFRTRLAEQLQTWRPSWVGISLSYLSQALPVFALIGLLRRDHPGVRIVLGGGLLTSWMRRPDWKNPFDGLADLLVDGPGEIPLLKLSGVAAPMAGTEISYAGTEWPRYFAPGPILPYDASRGCYWNRCAYCPEPAEGHPYQPQPPQRVSADLRRLLAGQNTALIHFTDNAMSPALLHHLVSEPPGVPWYGFVRVTHHLMDPDFCLGLKKSGCAMLKIGLESGDDAVLEGMKKGVNVDQAGRALATLAGAGIPTYIYLLFGTPWENESSAHRTLSFVRAHASAITFINPAIFNLPLASISAAGLQVRSFYSGDLQLYYDFHHPLDWDRKKVRTFLDRSFRREPAIAAILRRTPPAFTSNHAPFFAGSYRLNRIPS